MKTRTRLLAILLSVLLLLGVLPPVVFAAPAADATVAAEPVEAAEPAEEAADPQLPFAIDLPELNLPRSSAPAKAPRRNGEAPAAIDFVWDEATKALSINGVGDMADYPLGGPLGLTNTAPWAQYADKAEKLVVAEGITSIGSMDFALFYELKEAELPASLTKIGAAAFAYCFELEDINLPAGLTEIGQSAFMMNSLHSVVIPAGVEELIENFNYNSEKLSVTLPEGLRVINGCFAGSVMEELTIPASVESFQSSSIVNTRRLINRSATAVASTALASAVSDQAALLMLKIEIEGNKAYLLGNGEEPSLDQMMAAYGKYLDLINEVFGTDFATTEAFYAAAESGELDESTFEWIDYPMNGIEAYCLSGSAEHDALHDLAVPHFLLDQDGALCTEPLVAKCGDNMTWTLDETTGVLTVTGYGEMYDSYKPWFSVKDQVHAIRFVEDGGKITKIGGDAFNGFGTIDSIEIPSGVTQFGWSWLGNCTVGNFIIPAGFVYGNLDYIYYLFEGAKIETVTVDPANEFYFVENGGLYTKGDDSTLAYFFGSGDVVIKDGTVRINHYAVYRNDAVTSITIPASVVSIGQNYPFEGCSNLKKVILAQRTQPLTISAGMFQSCDALEEYIVSENDPFFTAVDGVLYSKDMKTLYAVPFAKTELTIPASVEGVVTNVSTAYSYRHGLEALTVENPSFNFGYLNSGNTTAFTMAKNAAAVTVTGHTGSTAEAFALKNGYRFVSLEGITIESVVFDLSGVPATVTIGDQADFWRWGITGVVTYSDGTTKTIRYANVSNNDFSIQFKYPRETGWRDNSSLTFDYLGDYEFKIVYGEFVEPFTITVQEANYHYEFDVSEAITEVKQYSSTSNYQQSHDVQMGEYWTSVTDSVLGVKLYKVFDDGVTERELQSLGSVRISYDGSDNWWGNLVNEDIGTYTVTFTKSDRFGEPIATTSINVQVVPGDYTFSVDSSLVPATVTQFDEFNTGNWGLQATLRLDDGTAYDISDKVTFYDVTYNTLDTSVPGEKTIHPYLSVHDDYQNATGENIYVTLAISLDPITVTVLPDETIDSIRIDAPAQLNLEKDHEYNLTDYVNVYVTRNGVEQQIEDENDIQFAGRDVSGGGTYGGKLCYLYNYGDIRIYTVSYAGESVQMKIRCKQLYTYKIVSDENIELTRADRDVTKEDLGLIVGWSNADGIMADITDDVVLSGDMNLLWTGAHTVTLRYHENKEIDLGWKTIGTITFNVVCDSHTLNFVDAVPGTDCTHAGTIAHYVCTACGKTFNDAAGTEEITDLTGAYGAHTFGDWIDAIAATCVDTGVKGHYTCSVCRKNFDADENEITDLSIAVDLTNHIGTDETTGVKAATCKEDGYTGDVICSACRNVKTAGTVISKSTVAHTAKKTAAKNATCDAAGNIEYYTCTVCGKLFKDAACTQETNANGVKIAAKGHAYGAWTTVRKATCTQEGQEQRVCANDSNHKETRPIAKTAHEDNGNGYCKNCGADLNGGNRCKCGKIHTGPFAWLIKFFHSIQYFFKNLFK